MDEIPVGDEQEFDARAEYEAVEDVIGQLEAVYGTDRDPIQSAVYYLRCYQGTLDYEEERNG